MAATNAEEAALATKKIRLMQGHWVRVLSEEAKSHQ